MTKSLSNFSFFKALKKPKKSCHFIMSIIDTVNRNSLTQRETEMKINSDNDDRRPNKILREELSKPILKNIDDLISYSTQNKNNKTNNIKNSNPNLYNNHNNKNLILLAKMNNNTKDNVKNNENSTVKKILESTNERNIIKIIDKLNYIGFNRYFCFNEIDPDTVKIATEFMTYKFFPKGTFIYKQDDPSTEFYGIISGEVSLRKEITSILNLKIRNRMHTRYRRNNVCYNDQVFTEEAVYKQGMCFGEWDLIKKKKRNLSAFTLENTECFVLSKEHFEYTFFKEILRSDMEKKSYVTKVIPSLKISKINKVLASIIPCIYFNGQFLYTEFDPAEYLYVLYQGEGLVKKFVSLNNISDPIDEKNKMMTLYKAVRGDILGVETINGVNKNYLTNFEVLTDFTVLYRIRLSDLKECHSTVVSGLQPIYDGQVQLINDLMKKKENSINNSEIAKILNSSSFNKNNFFNINSKNKFTSKIDAYRQLQLENSVKEVVNFINDRPLKISKNLKKNEVHYVKKSCYNLKNFRINHKNSERKKNCYSIDRVDYRENSNDVIDSFSKKHYPMSPTSTTHRSSLCKKNIFSFDKDKDFGTINDKILITSNNNNHFNKLNNINSFSSRMYTTTNCNNHSRNYKKVNLYEYSTKSKTKTKADYEGITNEIRIQKLIKSLSKDKDKCKKHKKSFTKFFDFGFNSGYFRLPLVSEKL